MTVYIPPFSFFIGYFQISLLFIIIGTILILKKEVSNIFNCISQSILVISSIVFIYFVQPEFEFYKLIYAPIIGFISLITMNVPSLKRYQKYYGITLILSGLMVSIMLILNDFFF